MANIGRVCVVGAGPAGLRLARTFLAQGVPFDVYERHHDVGGLWDQSNAGSPVYDSAHFISSKTQIALPRLSDAGGLPGLPVAPAGPRVHPLVHRRLRPPRAHSLRHRRDLGRPRWRGLEGDAVHRGGPCLCLPGLRQRHQLAPGDAQLPGRLRRRDAPHPDLPLGRGVPGQAGADHRRRQLGRGHRLRRCSHRGQGVPQRPARATTSSPSTSSESRRTCSPPRRPRCRGGSSSGCSACCCGS